MFSNEYWCKLKRINNTGKCKMKIKLLVAAAATVMAGSAVAQSAF
jgi:hypothetical protein